jgi:hypothetical protein
MNSIIIGIVSYVAGLLSGYGVSRVWKPSPDQKNSDIVLLVVTVIWALSMIIDIISPTYETSPLVHGLMGAIVGFFYRPSQTPKI